MRRQLNRRARPVQYRRQVHRHVRQDRRKRITGQQVGYRGETVPDQWLNQSRPAELGEPEMIGSCHR